MSIARHHRQKILAARENQEARDAGSAITSGSQHRLMLAQLLTHQRQLSQIQSISRRAATKKEILPAYAAYVEGALSAESGEQDDVLMTVMVWRIDAGDLDGALEIAEYALRHKLQLPARFNRDTATLIAEEIAEALLSLPDRDRIDAAHMRHMQHVIDLTRDSDMPDEVRAKLHKTMGLILQESDRRASIEHLSRALALNPRAGVKKLLEKLQKQVAEAAP